MTPQKLENLTVHPDFLTLVRRKKLLNWTLTLMMLVIYYGFVLLVAFSPSSLGRSLNGGVTTIGMVAGVAVILVSFALTGIYVYRANHFIDPLNDSLKREFQS